MTDNAFYSTEYLKGRQAVIDTASFTFWERKASQEVRKYTFGNINESVTIPEVVQLCACEVAEHLYMCDKRSKEIDQGVTSEKDGTWSASYESTAEVERNNKLRTKDIITTWLIDTGLMYCGV